VTISSLLGNGLDCLHSKIQKESQVTMKVDYFNSQPNTTSPHVFLLKLTCGSHLTPLKARFKLTERYITRPFK
jgi:hypothetical protein